MHGSANTTTPSERWGREAAAILMRSGARFDGIFCGSDQIARGVADALREAGRQVPEQVGIVGVDNWEVMVEGSPTTTDHSGLEPH